MCLINPSCLFPKKFNWNENKDIIVFMYMDANPYSSASKSIKTCNVHTKTLVYFSTLLCTLGTSIATSFTQETVNPVQLFGDDKVMFTNARQSDLSNA